MRSISILCTVLCLLGGCQAPPSALLQVARIHPDNADLGDRVELIGDGFPEGRRGSVLFEGVAYSPGRSPRPVRVFVPASSHSQQVASFIVTEELQAQFCGGDSRADHTTFRGQVALTFPSKNSASTHVSGHLDDAHLDLAAPAALPESTLEVRQAEAQRWLDFVGVRIESPERPRVTAVAANSRAARAGLRVGDVLRTLDGVTILSLTDLVPTAEELSSQFSIWRAEFSEPVTLFVSNDGFRNEPPKQLSIAVVLVGLGASIMLLFAAPLGRVLTWLERRLASRLRAANRERVWRLFSDPLARALIEAGCGKPLRRLLVYTMLVTIGACFSAMALAQPLFNRDFDLLILYMLATTSALSMGLISGGMRTNGWSLGSGLKAAFGRLLCHLPAAAAFVSIVLLCESFAATEIVRAQGGWPWGWHAFRSPLNLLGFALFTLSLIPEPVAGELGALLPEADGMPGGLIGNRSWLGVLDLSVVVLMSGFSAILFAGGWRVPGVSLVEQGASLPLTVAGALLLLAKGWSIALLILLVRWALPRLRAAQLKSLYLRWLLPLSLCVVGASAASVHLLKSDWARSTLSATSLITCALCLFTLLYLARRVSLNLRSTHAQFNVNPWL